MIKGWVETRRKWLTYFRDGPFTREQVYQAKFSRDLVAEINVLQIERLIADDDDGRLTLTASGRVLRVLYLMCSDQGGPILLADMRRFADCKRMPSDDILAALKVLEDEEIVIRRPSARAVKWELK